MSMLNEIRDGSLRDHAELVLDSILQDERGPDEQTLCAAAAQSFWRRPSRIIGVIEAVRQAHGFTPIGAREISERQAEIVLRDARGVTWFLNVEIESEAPFGIERLWLHPQLPADIEIRQATEADGPAL